MKLQIFSLALLVLLSASIISAAQVDAIVDNTVGKAVPQLVTNPVLESSAISMSTAQNSMNATITAMEAQQKVVAEAMKKASWARNLQTVQRLINIMESIICTSKNINVRLSYFDHNCIYDFGFEMNIVKISMASDFVSLVITEGVSMDTSGRLASINNAINKYEEAQRSLANLNGFLDQQLKKMSDQKKYEDTIATLVKR